MIFFRPSCTIYAYSASEMHSSRVPMYEMNFTFVTYAGDGYENVLCLTSYRGNFNELFFSVFTPNMQACSDTLVRISLTLFFSSKITRVNPFSPSPADYSRTNGRRPNSIKCDKFARISSTKILAYLSTYYYIYRDNM